MIQFTKADLTAFEYVPTTPEDGIIFHSTLVGGGSLHIMVFKSFYTTEERDAFVADMPKSLRWKLNSPTNVLIDLYFAADERTGAVNEAAGKRFRSLLKNAAKRGMTVTHVPHRVTNAQPELDDILGMIDQPIVVTSRGELVD